MKLTTTQKRLVYKALLSGRTLTANDALHELGVGRLASRINELRRIGQIVGFEIETRDIHFINSKTGRHCRAWVEQSGKIDYYTMILPVHTADDLNKILKNDKQ